MTLKSNRIIPAKYIDWDGDTAARKPGKNIEFPQGQIKDMFEFNSDQIDKSRIYNNERYHKGSLNAKYFERYPEHLSRKDDLKDIWFAVNTKVSNTFETLKDDNFYVVRPIPPFDDQGDEEVKFSFFSSKKVNSFNVTMK